MYKFIKYSICVFIAIILLSCNNDELIKNEGNVKAAKADLELTKFSNLNITKNVEADLENVNEIEKDNFKISEFSAKEKVVNYFESDLLQSQLKYQAVTIENEGKMHSYFLEVYTFEKSATYPETITKLKDFSGGLNVYSFDGRNLGSVGVRNGEATYISGKDELDILAKAINLFYDSSNITKKIPLCDKTYTQVVEQSEDRFRVVSVGTKILSVKYINTVVTRTTAILPYPCDGSGDRDAIILQRMAHYSHYSENGQYIGDSSILDLPPSCQSFNFSKTASLWQTALVKNISFNIILLSEKGITFMYSAKFRQPISFGMPTNHSLGGAPVSAGMAAELSAKALQITIKEVIAKYGRVKVSEMIVEQYFKERLLYNYPLITSGGRVNWTATENLPVTDYETTFMLPDDCE